MPPICTLLLPTRAGNGATHLLAPCSLLQFSNFGIKGNDQFQPGPRVSASLCPEPRPFKGEMLSGMIQISKGSSPFWGAGIKAKVLH